jgi:Rhodopirellula transposase DDE domain
VNDFLGGPGSLIIALIDSKIVSLIRRGAAELSGAARRSWFAWSCREFANGSPRAAETIFGWNRKAVARGLSESQPSSTTADLENELGQPSTTASPRGRPRVEAVTPALLPVMEQLLSDNTQADPQVRTSKVYTRVTGNSLRTILADSLGITLNKLPSPRTLRRLLNRNGHVLRRLRKTVAKKKIPQTNEIFNNVHDAHRRAKDDPSILRISIDNKAKVKLGPYSRGGKTRDLTQVNAADHDMGGPSITPCGLLEIECAQLFITFVQGPATADTTADQIEQWWTSRKHNYSNVKTIMIDLDNGPEVSSSRRQFMKRLIEFANRYEIIIELVYYPPYHSKYNIIERCWGILEQHWNGTQLETIQDAVQWAKSMTWKCVSPIVEFIDKSYRKGVTMTKQAFAKLNQALERKAGIDKWSVTIKPQPSSSAP